MSNPLMAGLLSLVIPGMGQFYAGRKERGAIILLSVILIGSLNTIFLSVFAASQAAPVATWSHTLPRVLHDVFAFYGIVFWIGQVVDAYWLSKESRRIQVSVRP